MKEFEFFWFRYFSTETQYTKDRWLRWVVYWIIGIPIFTGVALNAMDQYKGKALMLTGAGLLIVLGILWIIMFFYHNWRVRNER